MKKKLFTWEMKEILLDMEDVIVASGGENGLETGSQDSGNTTAPTDDGA